MRQIVVAMVLASALALTACGKSSSPPVEASIRPVLSAVVQPVAQRGITFVGTVEPRVVVQHAFRIGGTMVSRRAGVGDTVEKGEQLASLEATTLSLAVESARASLQSAQAESSNAAASESRQQQLFATNNASQADVDQAQEQAQAAQAGVVQAQSRLAQAEEQLGYAQLLAGFDGVVTAVGAEAGQVVSPGQMIVTLAQPGERDVVIDVPGDVASNVAIGTIFTVAPQLAPVAATQGRVREISPEADPVTRTWRLRIAVEDPRPSFWLGTTATATLEDGTGTAMTLPEAAIRKDGDETSVWVVDETAGTVASRPVTIGDASSGQVPVLAGLDGGERVVLAGVHSLAEGQQVKLPQGPGS